MNKNQLLIFAFLEGFSVLLIELLGGKLLSPYFGNSLVVWTSTIGVTMTSLAAGYFVGSVLTSRKNVHQILFYIFGLVSVWISFMPFVSSTAISIVGDYDLYTGSILAALLLFSFPLVLLGCSPALFVQLYKDENGVGASSGNIFSISTLGSILSSLILGFIIIESFGVRLPIIVFSYILFIVTCIILYKSISSKVYIALFALPLFFGFVLSKKETNSTQSIYRSESLNGQVVITDEVGNNQPFFVRRLLLNGIPQTTVKIFPSDLTLNESIWYYVHMDGILSSTKPAGSDLLLMGFGGGSIAQELLKLGFNIDAVEIDPRLPQIAKDYFYFDTTQVNFFIEDARYFLNRKESKKYDMAVLDLLHGEVQPNHVLTVEGLNALRRHLKDDALIVINYQSNYNEPKQPFMKILKTLAEAGFDGGFVPLTEKEIADYIFLASPTKLPNIIVDHNHINDCCFNNAVTQRFIQFPGLVTLESVPDSVKLSTPALIDDKPVLELLNQESIKTWRKNMTPKKR